MEMKTKTKEHSHSSIIEKIRTPLVDEFIYLKTLEKTQPKVYNKITNLEFKEYRFIIDTLFDIICYDFKVPTKISVIDKSFFERRFYVFEFGDNNYIEFMFEAIDFFMFDLKISESGKAHITELDYFDKPTIIEVLTIILHKIFNNFK